MRPANFIWRHGINIDKGYMFDHHQKREILLFQNCYVDILWNFLASKCLSKPVVWKTKTEGIGEYFSNTVEVLIYYSLNLLALEVRWRRIDHGMSKKCKPTMVCRSVNNCWWPIYVYIWLWRNGPSGPRPSHNRGLTITLRHTTLGRITLDEWSARRRDLYLTKYNTNKRQTSMSPARFEPAFPTSERPQTHAFAARPLESVDGLLLLG
jgi:hypothetical protein